MRKILVTLVFAAAALAQSAATPPHQPRGAATDISNADVLATVAKTATAAVSDQAIRVVSINEEYNIGVGVVHRAKTSLGKPGNANAVEHSQITEVYHFIEGAGTFVTGGLIENAREVPADSNVVKVLNGPSTGGGVVHVDPHKVLPAGYGAK